MKIIHSVRTLLGLAIVVCLTAAPGLAGDAADLETLSLEELMAVEITSVGKRPQRLNDAAAAVFVITQQDLKRSGATSIPEALRMVPGLHVARINANQWAISSRGFNGRFANKLLVLIDGRSVYSPLFSGVYWDIQDVLLEDIERIEVIRGPGATVWGANAVNGVINVITKSTTKTQGSLVSTLAGTEERQIGLRHGGTFGSSGTFRVYGKGKDISEGEDEERTGSQDAWQQGRFGFRMDWLNEAGHEYTLQGDLYRSLYDDANMLADITAPGFSVFNENRSEAEGGHLLLRWNNSEGRQLTLYYDRADRIEQAYEDRQDTFDIDWQDQFSLGERHRFIWGLGYRWTHNRTTAPLPEVLNFSDTRDSQQVFSGFIQDDIQLVPETLVLTLGTKLEHNSYTQFEIQPNARLAWKPLPAHTFWTAVSRAVRTPSRVEDTGTLGVEVEVNPFPVFPILVQATPNEDFESEELLAFEAGYRYTPDDDFSIDVTGFLNRYDNLRTAEFNGFFTEGFPFPTAGFTQFQVDNKASGDTLGAELVLNWQVLPQWRLQATYSYLNMLIRLDNDSTDVTSVDTIHEIYPHNQGGVRSLWDVMPGVDLDLWLRAVGEVENQNTPGYVTLDARLGWEINDAMELSLVGQNLLGSGHREFKAENFLRGADYDVRRSVYLQLRWDF